MTLQLLLFGNVLKPPAPSAAEFVEIGEIVDSYEPSVESGDEPRLSRQCSAVLECLKYGPVTNVELNRICFRYGARIHELRKLGYDIRKKQIQKSVYRYWLIMEEQNAEPEASE